MDRSRRFFVCTDRLRRRDARGGLGGRARQTIAAIRRKDPADPRLAVLSVPRTRDAAEWLTARFARRHSERQRRRPYRRSGSQRPEPADTAVDGAGTPTDALRRPAVVRQPDQTRSPMDRRRRSGPGFSRAGRLPQAPKTLGLVKPVEAPLPEVKERPGPATPSTISSLPNSRRKG